MKPDFALSLSFQGIRLLHRAAGGWRVVGDVGLDAADMVGELDTLRKTAATLEPSGVRSKLLLPNEQIKYLTIDTPGLGESARRAAAVAALDGATPYAVDDLVFDISIEGDKTHIAAVARETLAEAEGFAVEHKFQPVCFAAIPGDEAYLGEPSFGPTEVSAGLLDPDEEIEEDGIAVVVIGDIETPDGPVAADDAPEPQVAAEEPEPAPDATEDAPADPPDENAPPDESVAARAEVDIEADTQRQDATSDTQPAVTSPKIPPAPPLDAADTPPVIDPAPPQAAPIPDVTLPTETDASPAIGFASRRPAEKARTPQLGGATRSAAPPPPRPEPYLLDAGVTSGEIALEAEPPAPAPRSGFLSRRRTKASPKPKVQAPPPPSTPPPGTERERMTVFGAREAQIGGKPRFLGLILTAALLVFLAGVAAWASVFLDDRISLTRLFGDRAPEGVTAAAPDIETPDAPAIQTAALDPELTSEDSAVLDALSEPVQPLPPALPEPLSDAQIDAKYATEGIWIRPPDVPRAPAGLINLDDLYLTSIDPVSTANDAVALPPLASFDTDAILGEIASPQAAGTRFTLDDQGLVVATAAGALSPDGFTVYLGRPPLVPPATPARFQSEPEDTVIRSALAALRPQPRPGDLVENTERAQLDGLTRSELASYRPALRPQSLQEQAAAAAPNVNTDDAVAEALTAPDPTAGATRLAAAASLRPDTRPRNFSRIVQRAERAAPKDDVRVASAAAVAPRAVTPKIPSKASVAKQATVRNAINLRKVNLIGVYGKPSNRRALVRLGNGRYKKVVVGDRIDGGRVSAIGEGSLRYTKRGRDLVLKMPN